MYDYGLVTVDRDASVFSETGDIVMDYAGEIDTAAEGVNFEVVDGSQEGSYLWTRYTNSEGIPFEHLRHTNGHVYPDNPYSLIFRENPSVGFSIGEAILQFFIRNPRTQASPLPNQLICFPRCCALYKSLKIVQIRVTKHLVALCRNRNPVYWRR